MKAPYSGSVIHEIFIIRSSPCPYFRGELENMPFLRGSIFWCKIKRTEHVFRTNSHMLYFGNIIPLKFVNNLACLLLLCINNHVQQSCLRCIKPNLFKIIRVCIQCETGAKLDECSPKKRPVSHLVLLMHWQVAKENIYLALFEGKTISSRSKL